jgi:phosphomannomutase
MSAPSPRFLDYAPVSLAFGTSGLRGLVEDITDLEAYINVKGALRYFLGAGDVRAGTRVVLAGDLRPSTDRIMRASARAILDSGCAVENAGKVPTPALILRAITQRCAGVMVSGSHIPFDRNGIKLNKSVGEILKSDEPGILREVEHVRTEEYGRTAADSAFTSSGMLKTPLDLPPVDRAAEEGYVRRYTDSFAKEGLSGLRVLVYEHSAVGRDLLGRILRELGADVVAAGRAETFVPIDTENVTPELLDRLEKLVKGAEGKEPIDVVVSTDGDSDRPLVAAVLPRGSSGRRVRFLSGDLLGIVAAEVLRADAVVVPISANDAIERRMSERGALLRKTKIGSPYVIAGIDDLRREKPDARIVGWEANGGFLVGSTFTLGGGGVLRALPTRDSTLPILANLYASREEKISLSALWDRLPARFGNAGLIDNVPVAVSRAILARLIPAGDVIEVEYGTDDRVVDRGRPEPTALGAHEAGPWRASKATLARFFTAALGYGEITRINVLDGIRIYFDNGDVAHIRPSGNAPQLRIYANADSQARADQIVESGLREPDGVLRQMEKAFS